MILSYTELLDRIDPNLGLKLTLWFFCVYSPGDGYNNNYSAQEMQPECIQSAPAAFDQFRKPYEELSFAPRINSTPNGSHVFEHQEYFGYQQSNFYSHHEMMAPVQENYQFSSHFEISASSSANIQGPFKEPMKVPVKQKRTSKAKPAKKSLADVS